MNRIIRTASYALAILILSLSAFTTTMAQSQPYKYGFCQGLAGNPRVNNYSRMFILGPSSPPDAMSGFLRYLHKRYGGNVTQEIACRTFATAAEAETQYRQMRDEAAQYAATWPLVEIDWIPQGGATLSPGAPAPAAAPPASTGVMLDRWGRPIPTTAYWFCNSYVRKNSYASAPFVANTLDRSPTEMFEQFLDYLNKKYHEGGTATCNRYATQAEAEARIAQLSAEAPGEGRQFAMIDWTYKPGAPTAAAPAPVAAKPVAPAPAKPATAASRPAVYVICRSEGNMDLRRFYNPPVDGRGAGYAEWQASYGAYLVKQYGFKGSNCGCGNYPTREAAQKDYDSWVAAARATPTINGLKSPIIITNWAY